MVSQLAWNAVGPHPAVARANIQASFDSPHRRYGRRSSAEGNRHRTVTRTYPAQLAATALRTTDASKTNPQQPVSQDAGTLLAKAAQYPRADSEQNPECFGDLTHGA